MIPQELEYVRGRIFGKSIHVAAANLEETWACDNVNWTGFRCAVALNDGEGGYRDLTLEDWSPGGVTEFIASTTASLQAVIEARAAEDPEEFSDLIGEEL